MNTLFIEHGFLALTDKEAEDFPSVLRALGQYHLWHNPQAAVEAFKMDFPAGTSYHVVEVSVKRIASNCVSEDNTA